MRIRIRWNDKEMVGVLNETPTAKAVYAALPVSAKEVEYCDG